MTNEHESTIQHLREMLTEAQAKLDARTPMLADIIPHIIEAHRSQDSIDSYVVRDFFERHDKDITRFKEEYGRELTAPSARRQHVVQDAKL